MISTNLVNEIINFFRRALMQIQKKHHVFAMEINEICFEMKTKEIHIRIFISSYFSFLSKQKKNIIFLAILFIES